MRKDKGKEYKKGVGMEGIRERGGRGGWGGEDK
jgi:hypothetical protein